MHKAMTLLGPLHAPLCFLNIVNKVIPFIVHVSANIAPPMKHKTSKMFSNEAWFYY